MKTKWILVYRNTIEKHNEDNNLAEVLVTEDFFEQYFNEFKKEYYNTVEDFLDEYLADDTENFYDYAMKHNAVLGIEIW